LNKKINKKYYQTNTKPTPSQHQASTKPTPTPSSNHDGISL